MIDNFHLVDKYVNWQEFPLKDSSEFLNYTPTHHISIDISVMWVKLFMESSLSSQSPVDTKRKHKSTSAYTKITVHTHNVFLQ